MMNIGNYLDFFLLQSGEFHGNTAPYVAAYSYPYATAYAAPYVAAAPYSAYASTVVL